MIEQQPVAPQSEAPKETGGEEFPAFAGEQNTRAQKPSQAEFERVMDAVEGASGRIDGITSLGMSAAEALTARKELENGGKSGYSDATARFLEQNWNFTDAGRKKLLDHAIDGETTSSAKAWGSTTLSDAAETGKEKYQHDLAVYNANHPGAEVESLDEVEGGALTEERKAELAEIAWNNKERQAEDAEVAEVERAIGAIENSLAELDRLDQRRLELRAQIDEGMKKMGGLRGILAGRKKRAESYEAVLAAQDELWGEKNENGFRGGASDAESVVAKQRALAGAEESNRAKLDELTKKREELLSKAYVGIKPEEETGLFYGKA